MSGSTSSTSEFLARAGIGRGLSGLRDLVDELRPRGGERAAARPEHDGVRAAVLGVLAEQPADGYRIVRLLEERGDGGPTPGAGSVYPTLQLLADEGLTTAAEVDGRRTWTLTPAGRSAAEAARERPTAWAATASREPERRAGIARSGAQLAQTVALAAQTVAAGQSAEVAAVLDDARRRILAILARS